MKTPLALVLILFASHTAIAQSTKRSATVDVATNRGAQDNPVEIGKVAWGRDLDAALERSATTQKPVLVLFQEVPGCAGCQAFGKTVLSDPLLVEAIEDLFVPVVVFNNRSSGMDEEVRQRFKEPAWNYQVIRFLDSDAKDIVPRKDGVNSIEAVATRMIQTLKAAKQPVPKYLDSIVQSSASTGHSQAAFAMSCFWTGEYQLGNIDGVVATQAGWLDGREVTLVNYDPKQISLTSLASQAAKVRCAQKVYTRDGQTLSGLQGGTLDSSYRAASKSDQKKQIARWPEFQRIPGINAMQLTKINSLAPRDSSQAMQWLSPRQRKALASLRQNSSK